MHSAKKYIFFQPNCCGNRLFDTQPNQKVDPDEGEMERGGKDGGENGVGKRKGDAGVMVIDSSHL